MTWSLALTALLMGLAGGPHCIAMCGAASCGIGAAAPNGRQTQALLLFQIGRLLGYAILGAIAASAMQALGWLTVQSAAIRPVWVMVYAAAFLLGLVLLIQGKQPVWLERSARSAWNRIRRLQQTNHITGPVLVGMVWSLLPCGLLYSALMVAGLTGVIWQGAAVMALFVLGTSVSMMLGPWLMLRITDKALVHGQWGVRLAGLALMVTAGVALWMGLMRDHTPWCAPQI